MSDKKNDRYDTFETDSIGIAAFLIMHGYSPCSVTNIGSSIVQGNFYFRGNLDEIQEVVLKFPTSESRQFDDAMRMAKTLCRHAKGLTHQNRRN